MKDIKQLIKEWNDLKIHQTKGDWSENIPEDIWAEFFANKCTDLMYDLDVDKHRWYETSITVVRIPNAIIGVRSITQLYSESSEYDDCYHHLEFHIMEEVKTVSYRISK